jgi:superfamily II RNA helicase
MPSRDEIILEYMEQLPYAPYPIQEEAIYAWASADHGMLLSAPTGTGKTLVAEAAIYEGLKTGQIVYYSTPLIALTDQKLVEFQQVVGRWGYPPDSVGLVTGNRTVNPDAPIKVVVAEVLLNRLLHPEVFDFSNVGAVVMDEFHYFNDPQRGIVWGTGPLAAAQASARDAALRHGRLGAGFRELDGPLRRSPGDARRGP